MIKLPMANKAHLLELNSAIRERERYQRQMRVLDKVIAARTADGRLGSTQLLQRRAGLDAELQRAAAHERALRWRLESSAA